MKSFQNHTLQMGLTKPLALLEAKFEFGQEGLSGLGLGLTATEEVLGLGSEEFNHGR